MRQERFFSAEITGASITTVGMDRFASSGEMNRLQILILSNGDDFAKNQNPDGLVKSSQARRATAKGAAKRRIRAFYKAVN